MSVIIIGGGISGLYTAYKLKKKYPEKDVKILEKNDYLGGRIYTYHDRYFDIELGAGRFHTRCNYLIKLLKEFNLFEKKQKISNDFKVLDVSNPGLLQDEKVNEYIKKVITNVTETKESLQKITFLDYAKRKIPKKEAEYILDFFGYSSEIEEMNAYDSVKIIKSYFTNTVEYYILNGGLSQLVEKLVNALEKQGVKILKNRKVTNISLKDNEKFEIQVQDIKTPYKSDVCICAVTKDFLAKQELFKSVHKYLRLIDGKPLCRVYSKYAKEDIWFKNYPKITMNNKIRYIIPINKEEGVIMSLYVDGKYANYWNKIYETDGIEGVNKKYNSLIKKSLLIDIEDPLKTVFKYWNIGVAIYKPGFDSTTMPKKIMHPDENIKLFACGENYSPNNTAWIEGALDTSEYILTKI